MDSLQAQRIESLKAGVIAGLSFAVAYGIVTLLNFFVIVRQIEALNLLLGGAIAVISGFLFGITYRYIIRQDENLHLKDGAVLAFSLVRGLAPVELQANFSASFWYLGIFAVESIFCFAIARFSLDLALDRKWVKPFNLG